METKEQIILEHLKKGFSITQKGAIELCASYRLSAVIFKLKSKGHNIHSILRAKGKVRFSLYWLDESELNTGC